MNALLPLLSSLLILVMSCKKEVRVPAAEVNNDFNASNAVAAVVTREYLIAPAVTDPSINTAPANHFVSVQEGGVLRNSLFVFLPGTYRNPTVCRGITRKAASMGYHSIGLMYDNRIAGNPLCSATNDTTCHRRVRLEVVDGVDRHPGINVNASNSVINRLYKLLVYLKNTYPTQNWGQYILNGKPDWTKIIVAGHSQGGALAGVMGKFYPLKKVIMISIMDFMKNGKYPDWVRMPANRAKYYAITHPADELVPYPYVKLGWQQLGMTVYGPRVNIDWNLPPYGNTHTLISNIVPTTTLIDKYHNCTAVDGYIPKDVAGKYIWDKAWGYLIGL